MPKVLWIAPPIPTIPFPLGLACRNPYATSSIRNLYGLLGLGVNYRGESFLPWGYHGGLDDLHPVCWRALVRMSYPLHW